MEGMSAIILAIMLITIMFGMGLSLSMADFWRVFQQPKAVLVGLTNQLLILPIVGFALCLVLPMSPSVAVGIMILAACPGGATSNIITLLAKGDIALSVTLTGVASLLTIVSIPFIVQFSLTYFMQEGQMVDINEAQMIGQLIIIVILPVVAGMFIRAKATAFALKMDKPVRIASTLLLIVVTIGLVVKERDHVIPYFEQAGLATICLNVVTMCLGLGSALIFRLKNKHAISIAIESGVQNSALAMTIAGVTLQNTALGIPAAIYSLVMYATGFVAIYLGRKLR